MPGSTSALIAERADARFAPSVAVACDHTTAIKQSCDLSVGYDTRQLADPRDEVYAIGTKGRRSAIVSFKTPLHSGLAVRQALMAEMIADQPRQPLNSLTSRLNFSGFSMNMKCAPPSLSSKISVFAPLICFPIQT